MKNNPSETLAAPAPTRIRVSTQGEVTATHSITGKLIHLLEKEEDNILVQRWIGHVMNYEIKEILSGHIYQAVLKTRSTKTLNDLKRLEGSFQELAEWLNEEYLPAIIKATQGTRYNAFILPEDIFCRLEAEAYEQEFQFDGQYVTRLFDSEEDALEWLLSVN